MNFRYHVERAMYSPRLYQYACAINAAVGTVSGLYGLAYAASQASKGNLSAATTTGILSSNILALGVNATIDYWAVRNSIDQIVAEQAAVPVTTPTR